LHFRQQIQLLIIASLRCSHGNFDCGLTNFASSWLTPQFGHDNDFPFLFKKCPRAVRFFSDFRTLKRCRNERDSALEAFPQILWMRKKSVWNKISIIADALEKNHSSRDLLGCQPFSICRTPKNSHNSVFFHRHISPAG
jgi:hypothetical protein